MRLKCSRKMAYDRQRKSGNVNHMKSCHIACAHTDARNESWKSKAWTKVNIFVTLILPCTYSYVYQALFLILYFLREAVCKLPRVWYEKMQVLRFLRSYSKLQVQNKIENSVCKERRTEPRESILLLHREEVLFLWMGKQVVKKLWSCPLSDWIRRAQIDFNTKV